MIERAINQSLELEPIKDRETNGHTHRTCVNEFQTYNASPEVEVYVPVKKAEQKKIIVPTLAQMRRQDSSERDLFDIDNTHINLKNLSKNPTLVDNQLDISSAQRNKDRSKSGFSQDSQSEISTLSIRPGSRRVDLESSTSDFGQA